MGRIPKFSWAQKCILFPRTDIPSPGNCPSRHVSRMIFQGVKNLMHALRLALAVLYYLTLIASIKFSNSPYTNVTVTHAQKCENANIIAKRIPWNESIHNRCMPCVFLLKCNIKTLGFWWERKMLYLGVFVGDFWAGFYRKSKTKYRFWLS